MNHSPLLFYLIQRGRGSQSNPELIDTVSLVSQPALEIPCLYVMRLELQVGHPAYLGSSSGILTFKHVH